MIFLRLADVGDGISNNEESMCLGTLGVKVASSMLVTLLGKTYPVRKNLPGQRLGARSWYWSLRDFLFGGGFSVAQGNHVWRGIFSVASWYTWMTFYFMVTRLYWKQGFLTKFAAKVKISYSELAGIGSEMFF